MDRDLSLPFGQLALKTMLRSARRADRPADVALAAGMAGLVGVQSFCALGCSCAERALVCARVEANLSRIGLRAERAESLAALRRGRGAPVVWLNDGTPPVALIGRSAGVWEDANSRQDDAGVTGPALEDAPPNGTLWTVTTCERPEPGDVALTRAVLELVSDWLRPPVVGACRRAGRTRLGLGLSAYEMWLLALADCKRLSSQRRDAIRVGFERWTVGVSATAAFISHVAGRRRNAWAF
ncbi:MAG: hypothetical protein FJX72_18225, partial [Armatimonadetes bacterium]|nr:hypothetical protein [Armatimonadota bacterium]